MYTYLKNLFLDETMFIGLMRGLLLTFGVLAETGQLDPVLVGLPPMVAQFAGIAAVFSAAFIRSSSSASVPVKGK